MNILIKRILPGMWGCLFLPAMAQAQPFTPQNLGPGVNSACSEINPVLSVDGKTLFFTRVNYPDSATRRIKYQDIWFSMQDEEGTWTTAERLPDDINLGRFNAILAALPDGNTFMINGIFNKKGTIWLERGFSLIHRNEDGSWGKPVPVKIRGYAHKSRGFVANAYLTPDSAYIFLAYTKISNTSKLKLHIAKRKSINRYDKPRLLKGEINKGRSAESPFLSADKKVLYYSISFGRDQEDFDIYQSTRLDDSYRKWSKPEPVSDSVNSSGWESYYRPDMNYDWAYFCSVTNSLGKSDIFRIKVIRENTDAKITGPTGDNPDQALPPDTNDHMSIPK